MKQKLTFFFPLICILLAASLGALISCGTTSSDPAPTWTSDSSHSDASQAVTGSIRTDAYQAQLTYYEEQLRALRDELTQRKEAEYISTAAYKAKISALEEELKALQEATDRNQTIPVSGKDPAKPGMPDSPEPTSQFDKNDFRYKVVSGCVTIEKYTGDNAEVSIPAEIDGFPVTAIGEGAFQESTCQKIILPNTVNTIGWFAFYGSGSLSEVTIPASVTTIGYAAFDGCPSTMTIHCPVDSYASAFAASYGLRQSNQ